ncbi:hypothetical protein D3C79_420500 [compost metagenome]
MHQAGVVGDDPTGQRHQIDRLVQAGLARQHVAVGARQGVDPVPYGVGHLHILAGAEDPHLPAFIQMLLGHHGVVPLGPALGRAELGPRAEHQHRAGAIQAEPLQGLVLIDEIHVQGRMGNGRDVAPALHLCLGVGQRQIGFHHQRKGGLVAAHVVEQTEAVLTFPAGAHRNAGKPGDQRRLHGVGLDDGLIVLLGGQLLAEPAAGPQLEVAVAERHGDGLVHLGHPLQQGHAPGRRHHMQLAARVVGLECLVEALGHHHVADPGGADHQYLHRASSLGTGPAVNRYWARLCPKKGRRNNRRYLPDAQEAFRGSGPMPRPGF